MKRLWVRLSLMISGVLFLMFFLQFLAITFDQTRGMPEEAINDRRDSPEEIKSRLVEFMAFSVIVGTAGGLIIGRVVSAPLRNLANAASRIGRGELDVTIPVHGSQEIIDLAETFNRMAAELKHAETLRNNLMADISHELRTPLTVLEGNLRAALDHVYELDESEIANLYGQTRHLIRLVNDLRELSLAESGQLSMVKQPTDLKILAVEALQALEPLAAEKNVQVVNETSEISAVNVDPDRIRQVIINLLSNSLRHSPVGGKITLGIKQNQDKIIISIQDTGEGLETYQLASIFDRFYRVDKSRNRESGGTGLGLAIVKAIIEAHGGRTYALSEGRDHGSTFVVELPV